MKTIMTATLILSVTILLLVSCTTIKPTTTEVIVLNDITEESVSKPDANEILKLLNVSENIWNGSRFYFEDITDVSYNSGNNAAISSQGEWMGNEPEREKELKNFRSTVSDIIENAEKQAVGKNGSSIYLPIARKLNELSKSKSQKRILIIYSDMMENTTEISFYNKKTMKVLKALPEEIKAEFKKMQPIEDLDGIEVHIVFQPIDQESDTDFKTVSEFYKQLLEDKGATVTISANLNI